MSRLAGTLRARGLAVFTAAASLAATGTAQFTLDLHVAADPDQTGPPVWTWLREQLPHAAPDGVIPDSQTALGPLTWHFRSDDHTPLTVTPSPDEGHAQLGGHFATGIATWNGAPLATLTLEHNGHETWVLQSNAIPPRLVRFTQLLGISPVRGTSRLDIAAATAELGPPTASHDGSALAVLSTRGAVECDILDLHTHELEDDGTTQWIGQSSGGLLLPCVILLLADAADHQADLRQTAHWADAPEVDKSDPFHLLAFAARDDARLEAAAQLALDTSRQSKSSPAPSAAVDVLERLLWAHDDAPTRNSAIESLIRHESSESLAEILQAIPEPQSSPTVHAAFANLWPLTNQRTRDSVFASCPSPPAAAAAAIGPTSAASPARLAGFSTLFSISTPILLALYLWTRVRWPSAAMRTPQRRIVWR